MLRVWGCDTFDTFDAVGTASGPLIDGCCCVPGLSGRAGHVRYNPATVFAMGAPPMTQPDTTRTLRRHRWRAAVAAVAMLAAPAAPAAADGDTAAAPDHLAPVSACVGAAGTDRGFVDVAAGSVFAANIDCLAHYRITNGCGDGTRFCPTRPLTRWEAALFLARAATAAGVDLPPAREAFDDIDETQHPEGVAAVAAVTAAGIITADGATFDPLAVVTRAGMAVFVANFLAVVSPAVALGPDETYLLGPDRQHPDAVFCDTAGLDDRTASAIDAIYELGVTKGRGTGTGECVNAMVYDPSAVATRAHLAAFLTRALAPHQHPTSGCQRPNPQQRRGCVDTRQQPRPGGVFSHRHLLDALRRRRRSPHTRRLHPPRSGRRRRHRMQHRRRRPPHQRRRKRLGAVAGVRSGRLNVGVGGFLRLQPQPRVGRHCCEAAPARPAKRAPAADTADTAMNPRPAHGPQPAPGVVEQPTMMDTPHRKGRHR